MRNLQSTMFSSSSSRARVVIAATVVLFLFCLLPFASALEVHHIFSEIDHDSHEHSDFDLCQWVQAHSSGSIDLDHAEVGIPLRVDQGHWAYSEIVVSSAFVTSYESRGPPLFL